VPDLVQKALDGDTRSIARMITMVENESPHSEEIMKAIYPHTGRAHIIGITGSPGSGKSTLTDKLIDCFKKQGKSIGVIAVDPSSPFTGGAILADRIRMQKHSVDPSIFIRSMGTRGSLGGLSKSTYEASMVLDACGKDVIFIETVGVGQSEVDIVKIADSVCLVLVPGMGDDIQIMKAGIMEIADLFVVNKADKEGHERIVSEVKVMLDLAEQKGWNVPVLTTIAENGTGVQELADSLAGHLDFLTRSKEGAERKKARISLEIKEILQRQIARFAEEIWHSHYSMELMDALVSKKTDPYSVVKEVLDKALSEH